MEGYKHITPLTVRYADLDVMGHLNHAKYLTYMEHARIRYMEDVIGFNGDWETLGLILARAEVDYVLPVDYKHEILVYTRCARVGKKSFDLEYVIVRKSKEGAMTVAKAKTVMVAYDYKLDKAIVISDDWRNRFETYEPILKSDDK